MNPAPLKMRLAVCNGEEQFEQWPPWPHSPFAKSLINGHCTHCCPGYTSDPWWRRIRCCDPWSDAHSVLPFYRRSWYTSIFLKFCTAIVHPFLPTSSYCSIGSTKMSIYPSISFSPIARPISNGDIRSNYLRTYLWVVGTIHVSRPNPIRMEHIF